MFLVENSIPFRNGVLIQGHFQVTGPQLVPGDQLIAEKDGKRVGLVRFMGILNANFSHNPSNPRYHLSVAFDSDYRLLQGATLSKLKTA
jgi:hypothetical protein